MIKRNILFLCFFLLITLSCKKQTSNVEDIVGTFVVHNLGGLFVPAHVDRSMNGLYAQLGFLPEGLEMDGVEISRWTQPEAILRDHPELAGYQLLQNSDAHFVKDIGRCSSRLLMKELSFKELGLALRGKEGRKVIAG